MVFFDWLGSLFSNRKPNFTKEIPRLEAEWQSHKNKLAKFPSDQQARLEVWGKRLWKRLERVHSATQQIINQESNPQIIRVKVDALFEPFDVEIDEQRGIVEDNYSHEPPPIQRWREMVLESIERHAETLESRLDSYNNEE